MLCLMLHAAWRRMTPPVAGPAQNVIATVVAMSKTNPGNFFEDFRIGQVIRHATPRTVTTGDVALYNALYGAALRRAVVGRFRQGDRLSALRRSTTCWSFTSCSARRCRISRSMRSPISAMPAAAFCSPVYPGDTLSSVSEVIGLKENSSRKTGVVYVRSTGFKQDGTKVARIRALGDGAKTRRGAPVARRTGADAAEGRSSPMRSARPARAIDAQAYDLTLAGSASRWGDYAVGEKIDHVDGFTVEEAEHMLATRLYQNTARIHFNQFTEAQGPLQAAADLWRRRYLAGAGALL